MRLTPLPSDYEVGVVYVSQLKKPDGSVEENNPP